MIRVNSQDHAALYGWIRTPALPTGQQDTLTTFAFQPWHGAIELKRYLVRFTHMVSGFNQLHGIMRTVYNKYDSLVLPLRKWLDERGVVMQFDTRVTDLLFAGSDGSTRVEAITYERDGLSRNVAVHSDDLVIATLGSMTDGSAFGAMDTPAVLNGKGKDGAWTLWEAIAEGRPELGRPAFFADNIDESKWVSFTVTLKDPDLFRRITAFTGNVPGEGGLITFTDSPWLMSIVLPHQPHFIGQPDDVQVFWGYALKVDVRGDHVATSIANSTGREILTELLGQLDMLNGARDILAQAICLPCVMPFITSQFLNRSKGTGPPFIRRATTIWRSPVSSASRPTMWSSPSSIRSGRR